MSNAERPPGIVPTPYYDDGVGYQRAAMCALCAKRINARECMMAHLPSDPASLSRPVHTRCAREYATFCQAMGG